MRFHSAYETLPLPLAPNQGHTPSLVRFRLLDIGYQRLLTRNNALPETKPADRQDLRVGNSNFAEVGVCRRYLKPDRCFNPDPK
jgi:hypothetical protein